MRRAELLRRVPRRAWFVAACVVVAAAVVVTLVAWPRPDVDERVAAAFAPRDRAPTGPIVGSIPPACGVSFASMDALVPGVDEDETIDDPDTQRCEWSSTAEARALGGRSRDLEIEVEKEDETAGTGTERLAEAVEAFTDDLPTEASGSDDEAHHVRRLTGLGSEAIAWYTTGSTGPVYPDGSKAKRHPDELKTTILFRQGNLVASVTYGGTDYTRQGVGDVPEAKSKAAPERETFDGARRAARDVARSMDLTAAEAAGITETKERTGRPVTRSLAACDVLPPATVRRLVGTASPDSSVTTGDLIDRDAADTSGCQWSGSRDLDVEVGVVPDTTVGPGERVAALRYLSLYYQAMAPQETSEPDATTFARPLRRPGQQAFLAWTDDATSDAQVVLRIRNVLVRVEVSSADPDRYDKRQATAEAYDAAVAAAGSVPR
jgi:hypothetical protein